MTWKLADEDGPLVPLLPHRCRQYWQRRWQAEREDQSLEPGSCVARAIQPSYLRSADDASFLKEMGMEEHATVVVLKDELVGEG